MGDIKKECADMTSEELRELIYEEASGKNRQIGKKFSKNQLFEIAKSLGCIDGYKCYFCGLSESECLETHHIIPRSMNGPDAPHNLVELCANCHRKIEELYDPVKLNTIVENTKKIKKPKELWKEDDIHVF